MMEFMRPIIIGGMSLIVLIMFISTLLSIVSRLVRKNKVSRQAGVAAGVGGAASLAFLQQLINEQQLNQEMIQQMEQMNLQQMQEFALQNQLMDQMLLQQMMHQAMDPYQNVGMDPIVDHYHHGHDHGFDHSMNHHNPF